MAAKLEEFLRLRGVRQNNLQNIDLDLPIGKLIVVTGLSGAGKSSLVFDALHAEGHRRYAETFSTYARQFLDLLDRPKLDSVENIRPSIAIEQGNSVKTSRSTVGTMTELCDYFKVWFAHVAELFDPATGEEITIDTPDSIWRKSLSSFGSKTVLLAFEVRRPKALKWDEILGPLSSQGYTRAIVDGKVTRLDELSASALKNCATIFVIQDRLKLEPKATARFKEAATTALHFGEGHLHLFNEGGTLLKSYCEGLHLPGSEKRFRPATPNLFSFNSALGACPRCRGFGRIIELDDRLVIPDASLSIDDGVVRAFSGAVYSESQRDLLRACRKYGIHTNVPWARLSDTERDFVWQGEPGYVDGAGQQGWYGVRRFFRWLEENTYKMHVRVFLSRYRAYVECPDCGGNRLQSESLCWKWQGWRLPDLYRMPIRDLAQLMRDQQAPDTNDALSHAYRAIVTRLGYLEKVGLGYLSLDRSSRSLSGGETQRVHLTSCLGTSLIDTLFILDEPSVGLHARDIHRLVDILRELADNGNTVVVVEHDESVMAAADHIVEIGPEPGRGGGKVVYSGPAKGILALKGSPTGDYLSGRRHNVRQQPQRKVDKQTPMLRLRGVTKHNLQGLDVDVPLRRLVALSGVSGSGKSTLLSNAIYQGLLARSGKAGDDPAVIAELSSDCGLGEVLLVDQSAASKTPRSNPALFVGAWDHVRNLFARSDKAVSRGYTAAWFSFNSGSGRCPHCNGLGHERIEMQFMADVYVRCPVCEGRQFRDEVLEVQWKGHSIADVLGWSLDEAIVNFAGCAPVVSRLMPLQQIGLGYLTLGQPLNTLSGGESQRLKLVRFMGGIQDAQHPSLLLLDEPTTGLHRADVARLLNALQNMVDQGHSIIVIEHHADVLRAADWVIELGPEAGDRGGKLVFAGTPGDLCNEDTATSPFLRQSELAEPAAAFKAARSSSRKSAPAANSLLISGAREHNLKNISVAIPLRQMTVVTGLSGSGKSTLAFDIAFAEGQRRFMESMSSWARQYVEQLPKPDVDSISCIPPTIAIEQRVTRGGRKSTVATITEVAQYLRLLYARVGHQHSPSTDEPLIAMQRSAIPDVVRAWVKAQPAGRQKAGFHLLAPLLRGRKGHHEPIAKWAAAHGYPLLRIDGDWVPTEEFKRLDRYREHSIEVAVGSVQFVSKKLLAFDANGKASPLDAIVGTALDLGRDAFMIASPDTAQSAWFSTRRSDPVTGEAFPELDPKDFSWNAARGWCPCCHGYGVLEQWMVEDERFTALPLSLTDGDVCPDCHGQRLNAVSRHVYLYRKSGDRMNLPSLLHLTPQELLGFLKSMKLDAREQAIFAEILPEIEQRLAFMQEVGLGYLSLDRSATTLSGGEAQRIRLAAQLGSNLTGALYVLDEPSIGLHERDNERLLKSLRKLKDKGNTLLVVEHDAVTMQQADHIIDLGPAAGIHGGEVLTSGTYKQVLRHKHSLTAKYLRDGIPHPLLGNYRALPGPFRPRAAASLKEWLVLKNPCLRNLKGDDLFIPKSRMVVVCGISGAGKSTLVRDLLMPAVRQSIQSGDPRLKGNPRVDGFSQLLGAQDFRSVIEVDQSPIGKTPRSTPATYIGIFDRIRELFASLPDAQVRGYTKSTFSFNTKGGRCETCKGAGRVKLEMNFIPDSYVDCDDCGGCRFGSEIRDIRWNGKSIVDVLKMSFEEAAAFFTFDSQLKSILNLMVETGLGYLSLGQSSPSLSGGEAQRLKLVSELARGTQRDSLTPEPILYILEEPTIGLHLHDVERLIHLLHRLIRLGHSVLVIEHHLDVISEADYVVEVGPEGGDAGGKILYQGELKGLKMCNISETARFLQ